MFTDQDVANEVTTEENTTTEHEDDINQSSTIKPIIVSTDILNRAIKNKQNEIFIDKNINLDVTFNNNLQSNDIPKLADTNNYLSNDLAEKLEDEKNRQHKIMHEEYSRHGNFETIFTQPTDHFVPPLVMAKAKLSDDMTVLSLEEKHAQQLAEQRYSKHLHAQDHNLESITSTLGPKTIDDATKITMTDKPLITTKETTTLKDDIKKDILKTIVPKKYNDKFYGLKGKNSKTMDVKPNKIEKLTEIFSTPTTDKPHTETAIKYVSDAYSDRSEDEPTIDLTVIINEPGVQTNKKTQSNFSSEIPKIEIIQNDTSISEPEIKLSNPVKNSEGITQKISVKLPTKSMRNLTLAHEVIKITILREDNSSAAPTVFEVTTKMPVFDGEEDDENPIHSTVEDVSTKDNIAPDNFMSTSYPPNRVSGTTTDSPSTTSPVDVTTNTSETIGKNNLTEKVTQTNQVSTTEPTTVTTLSENSAGSTGIQKSSSEDANTSTVNVQSTTEKVEDDLETEGEDEDLKSNTTDTAQTIDDFQSPLLSGANEPLHRPNRSRRPQPPPNRNKFNPFRILG